MSRLVKLGRDLTGLARLCGPRVAIRWSSRLPFQLTTVFRRRDLQPADAAMGEGPFSVALPGWEHPFQVVGPAAFSGIREMYVRDVYRRDWWLKTGQDDVIVDLGANMGNFSAMALARDTAVHVIAIEPSRSLNSQLVRSLGLNRGFLERTQLIRAFVGSRGRTQQHIVSTDANYGDAEWMTEEDLIRRTGIRRIAILKCDIEGSEFGLLGPESKLLAMTTMLACEVHSFAGDVSAFVSGIEASGFVIGSIEHASDGSAILLARRNGVARLVAACAA